MKLFGFCPLSKVPVKLKAASYFASNFKMAADAWNCNVLWPTIKTRLAEKLWIRESDVLWQTIKNKKAVLGIPEKVPRTEVSWSWIPVAAGHLFRKGLAWDYCLAWGLRYVEVGRSPWPLHSFSLTLRPWNWKTNLSTNDWDIPRCVDLALQFGNIHYPVWI